MEGPILLKQKEENDDEYSGVDRISDCVLVSRSVDYQ